MVKSKWILLVLLLLAGCGRQEIGQADKLYEDFVNPPAEARPFVRWWWNGDCVEENEILRQLDLLKDAGIGGVEINPIEMPLKSKKTDAKSLTWLSDEWNQMVKVACEGTKERGMIADLIVGSGWPFGGKFLKLGETIQGVGLNKKALKGPGVFNGNIKELMKPMQHRREPDKPGEPELLFIRLVPQNINNISDCIDLRNKVERDGTIIFDIPAGEHTLYVGTFRENFKAVGLGAPGADGPVLDHYNKEAVEKYLGRLSKSLGPVLGGKLGDGLRAMFCDSIELSGANWTSGFEKQFMELRGYSIEPYLPFVFGQTPLETDSAFDDTILRVRYDFYKTLVEMFSENFIKTFHGWCNRNGTQSRYQAYGSPWLMGMLDGYMAVDIPEGDTWIFGHPPIGEPIDNIRYAVWNKYASSGAHLRGKRLVGCESMTNVSGVFLATLEYIKQADDLNFITGVNHSILHGFNYSPPQAGFPGWIRYGTYFNEQNPWWPYVKKWSDYNARLSSVFQSSKACAEVAIFGPTADVLSRGGLHRDPLIKTPWYLHRLWQAVHKNGYCGDYVNATVLEGAKFEGGKLRFGPMSYDVLIICDVETVRSETAEAIERYASAGGKIIFVGKVPSRTPGFKDAKQNDAKVKEAIVKALRSDKKRVGVIDGPKEGELLQWTGDILARFGVEGAVKISKPDERLFQVHYKKDGRDIFFFANSHRDKDLSFQADFTTTGGKTAWRWDAETGQRSVFPYGNKKNQLDIKLKALESLLVVFEPDMGGGSVRKVDVEWEDYLEIAGPWDARLNHVQKPAERRRFNKLEDFGKSEDTQLNTFAGVVVYKTRFNVEGKFPAKLSLGKVYNTSEVRLNGKPLGVRWWGEHSYDVGDVLKVGENVLEVKVTTVVSNYCRGLKDNPTAQRWAANRVAFSAGLVGPVKLLKSK